MRTQAWKLEFINLRNLIQIAGDLCALFCSWKLTLSSSQPPYKQRATPDEKQLISMLGQ